VRSSSLGRAIINAFPDIGFWTFSGDVAAKCGDEVRAALVRHENTEGVITLMPYPCTPHAVVALKDYKPQLYAEGDAVTDLPLSFLFALYLDPSSENEMTQWSIFWGAAFDILRTATSKITFATVETLPPHPITHYQPLFVPSIPPRTQGATEPLARTFYPADRAPRRNDGQAMWFNQSFAWAAQPADNTRFDFTSVLAHEIGHALGLGHEASTSCLMFESFNPGTERRTLCTGETNRLRDLYGS
jgi:hypothetical protein